MQSKSRHRPASYNAHAKLTSLQPARHAGSRAISACRPGTAPFPTRLPTCRMLSEAEAHDSGWTVRVASLPMTAVLRTRTTSQPAGFMKALVDAEDRIVGFTMIGAEADEVLAVVQTAMLGHLPYQSLRDAILTHPTMAEGLNALFGQIKDS